MILHIYGTLRQGDQSYSPINVGCPREGIDFECGDSLQVRTVLRRWLSWGPLGPAFPGVVGVVPAHELSRRDTSGVSPKVSTTYPSFVFSNQRNKNPQSHLWRSEIKYNQISSYIKAKKGDSFLNLNILIQSNLRPQFPRVGKEENQRTCV